MSAPTVAIATLGCRLNQVDSQDLAARLEHRGFRTVPFETPADVVVVNTCTVTGRADASDRQMIRRAARAHPRAQVVVTGCWAQTDPAAVATLREVDAVVGNADKPRLPEIVLQLLSARHAGQGPDAAGGGASCPRREEASPPPACECRPNPRPHPDLAPRGAPRPVLHVSDIRSVTTLSPAPLSRRLARSRAFLKVQEGCQHRCAFCIVPMARGVSRSLDPKVVLDQARQLVESGHPEIVLTGVDLGHYGADLLLRTTLAALLRDLVELSGLRWVRLSSVLPAYFTPDLIDVVTGSAVIAPHLHIPLQSGSDRVLRAMRRPYNAGMYRRLIQRLVTAIPRLGLGADVIVGFPGESEDDFTATMRFVEALPFSYLHVFGYSDRLGTAAAGRPDHVDPGTIARRSRELRALTDAKSLVFRKTMVGVVETALVLENRDRATGALVALTGNYEEVLIDGADDRMRRMTRVRVTDADGQRTRGELVA